MIPGKPQILTCPYCGKKKKIMTLMSGNTFGSVYWSDAKRIASMLPEISYVQKCPQCGKYYIKSRQEIVYAKNGCSFERGILTFPEMKEAYQQLSEEGFLSMDEERQVRMMLHHAYNDYYYRGDDTKEVIDSDFTLFRTNALWLIKNLIKDPVLKAEFYREIGEMDTSQSLLNSLKVEDDFHKNVVDSIQKRIDENDCKVFIIE